ncbi:DNA polymerase III subunit chi [Beggiatoa alba]|nr:DNA polymerase III subunit chi [Beggiatoa alba]
MTSIDFYISESQDSSIRDQLACRLSEKAIQTKAATFIHTQTEQHSQQIDKLLWTFKPHSFIPHQLYQHADAEKQAHPILIGHDVEPEKNFDLLINLSSNVPAFYSRFKRVIEIVGNDPQQRELSRKHYTFYKDRGYIINTHNIK